MTMPEAYQWLGVAREWIQSKARDGSKAVPGTNNALDLCNLTVRDIESLAEQIKDSVAQEMYQSNTRRPRQDDGGKIIDCNNCSLQLDCSGFGDCPWLNVLDAVKAEAEARAEALEAKIKKLQDEIDNSSPERHAWAWAKAEAARMLKNRG